MKYMRVLNCMSLVNFKELIGKNVSETFLAGTQLYKKRKKENK